MEETTSSESNAKLEERVKELERIVRIHEQDLSRFYADIQALVRKLGQAAKGGQSK